MLRISVLALAAAASSACAPLFDVELAWTIDGEDPAESCEFLPKGSVVRVNAVSREKADERFGGAPVETQTDFPCADGIGKLQVGNFADVRAEIVEGDDVFGTSSVVELDPGASNNNYQREGDDVATADIRLIRGTLHASFTVVGQSCGDAGADSFNVTLSENTEPRTQKIVEEQEVACEDGVAEVSFAPVDLEARYVIEATTIIAGEEFRTQGTGEGIEVRAANTFFTVDLQTADSE